MSGLLFEDTLEWSKTNYIKRLDKFYDNLTDIFSVSNKTEYVSIIDPHFDQDVLIDLDGNRVTYGEENLWTRLLREFAMQMQTGDISIISSMDGISTWNKSNWMSYRSSKGFPYLSNFIIDGNDVTLASYYWSYKRTNPREGNKAFPRRLHDRFIIIDDKGWQIGMHINDINQKDILVTQMDGQLVAESKLRFDHMKDTCSLWKENSDDE